MRSCRCAGRDRAWSGSSRTSTSPKSSATRGLVTRAEALRLDHTSGRPQGTRQEAVPDEADRQSWGRRLEIGEVRVWRPPEAVMTMAAGPRRWASGIVTPSREPSAAAT